MSARAPAAELPVARFAAAEEWEAWLHEHHESPRSRWSRVNREKA